MSWAHSMCSKNFRCVGGEKSQKIITEKKKSLRQTQSLFVKASFDKLIYSEHAFNPQLQFDLQALTIASLQLTVPKNDTKSDLRGTVQKLQHFH